LSTKVSANLYSRVDSFPTGLSRFVNKTVPYRFNGRDLTFRLSHALFSSFDIDAGSRLLLKSLAQRVDFRSVHSALDIGCGVGVIGACIASQSPEAHVLMQDRDALAAAFAAANAQANGMERVAVSCGLAFWGLDGRTFDLVVSNLPAKAGLPVLRSFLRHAAGCLSPQGRAAIVIVATLAQFATETLAEIGCEIVYTESTRAHVVLHFGAGSAGPETDLQREDITPYIRSSVRFEPAGYSYSLRTVHALPDFDTLGYDIALLLDIARELPTPGRILVWNPGQGHIPAGLLSRRNQAVRSITIASRDSLQCVITALNIAALGAAPANALTVPEEAALEAAVPQGPFDAVIASPQPVPRVPWQVALVGAANALLAPGGALLAVCSSTEMHRFMDQARGFQVISSKKHLGFRAAFLRKI
jgi:protein-L-isoaspartate O-methyltransferase